MPKLGKNALINSLEKYKYIQNGVRYPYDASDTSPSTPFRTPKMAKAL